MVGRSRLVVVLLGVLGTTFLSHAAVVQGKVLLPDGKPAAGAPVWLLGYRGIVATSKTDAAGAFRFARCGEAYEVAAKPQGAALAWATFDWVRGGTVTLQARAAVIVEGTVVGLDGRPIAGAEVSVTDIDPKSGFGPMFGGTGGWSRTGTLPTSRDSWSSVWRARPAPEFAEWLLCR